MTSTEIAIAQLLGHRYGDGGVYVPRDGAAQLLRVAIDAGFLSEDGYVTRKGRALVARQLHSHELRG